MTISANRIGAVLSFAVLVPVAAITLIAGAAAHDPANDKYTLSTQFRGPGMNLDIVNGGQYDNFAHLAAAGNYSGQLWHLVPAPYGAYRLTTEFRGAGMCLDIVNGGPLDNMAHLAPCADYSGQYWYFRRSSDGTYTLTTAFRGDGMCLDVFNGGEFNDYVHLAPCGNYSGQIWTMTLLP